MMTEPRTEFMDPDYRRNPKTPFFCIRCQKDIKPGQGHRWVYCGVDLAFAVHPEDVTNEDKFPIGSDCAKKIGLEWSVE
jgi:hypothetical protein